MCLLQLTSIAFGDKAFRPRQSGTPKAAPALLARYAQPSNLDQHLMLLVVALLLLRDNGACV